MYALLCNTYPVEMLTLVSDAIIFPCRSNDFYFMKIQILKMSLCLIRITLVQFWRLGMCQQCQPCSTCPPCLLCRQCRNKLAAGPWARWHPWPGIGGTGGFQAPAWGLSLAHCGLFLRHGCTSWGKQDVASCHIKVFDAVNIVYILIVSEDNRSLHPATLRNMMLWIFYEY